MFVALLIVCTIACFLFFLGNSKIKGGFGTKLFYTLIAAPVLTLAIMAAWHLVGVLIGTVVLVVKIAIAAAIVICIALAILRFLK